MSTEKEPKKKTKTLSEVNDALLRIVAMRGKLKELPPLFVEGVKAALLWSSGDKETCLSGVLDDGELFVEPATSPTKGE